MKKLLSTFLFVPLVLFGQNFNGLNFKGTVTDENGWPVSMKDVSVKISILNNSTDKLTEYSEVHSIKTGVLGDYSVFFGLGQSDDNKSNVSWNEEKFMSVEVDYNLNGDYFPLEMLSLKAIPKVYNPYHSLWFNDYIQFPTLSPLAYDWERRNKLYFKEIGWSENNVFAYMLTGCCEENGCGDNKFIIQNSITNEVLETIYFGRSEETGELTDSLIFDSKLALIIEKYKIVKSQNVDFVRSSLINESDLNIFLNSRLVVDSLNCFSRSNRKEDYYKVSYDLVIGNDQLGYKLVSKGIGNCYIDEVKIEGYYFSPFDNIVTIALVKSTKLSGGDAGGRCYKLELIASRIDDF